MVADSRLTYLKWKHLSASWPEYSTMLARLHISLIHCYQCRPRIFIDSEWISQGIKLMCLYVVVRFYQVDEKIYRPSIESPQQFYCPRPLVRLPKWDIYQSICLPPRLPASLLKTIFWYIYIGYNHQPIAYQGHWMQPEATLGGMTLPEAIIISRSRIKHTSAPCSFWRMEENWLITK